MAYNIPDWADVWKTEGQELISQLLHLYLDNREDEIRSHVVGANPNIDPELAFLKYKQVADNFIEDTTLKFHGVFTLMLRAFANGNMGAVATFDAGLCHLAVTFLLSPEEQEQAQASANDFLSAVE